MAEKARLDTTRLQKMATAYWESAALMAAVELDIFTAIERGHDTVPALAKAAGITDRNAERLLTALTAMTLIDREGERFANAPDVQRFLVKDSDRYAGPWILFTKPRWTSGALEKRSPLRSSKARAASAVSSRSALRSLIPTALASVGMVSWQRSIAVNTSSSTAAIRAALSQ